VQEGGTYICIEGPQFSTKAESKLYRSWGASLIGMTAMPEARLAREAELCYATLAMVTDYDVWHDVGPVSVEMVLENLHRNTDLARRILVALCESGLPARSCRCGAALRDAIVTPPEAISTIARTRLGIIADKYLPPPAL
jgi:5'-methylthioadenosine phosphorylase